MNYSELMRQGDDEYIKNNYNKYIDISMGLAKKIRRLVLRDLKENEGDYRDLEEVRLLIRHLEYCAFIN